MNLPNKITLTRICLIPVFAVVFYLGVLSPWCYLAAGVIFSVAAATDFLDGYIARKQHLVTNLGKFLDPIADKVLVSTALVLMLTVPASFTVAPFGENGLITAGVCVAVIIARELIVSGFRMVAAGRNIVMAADMFGKVKTCCQDFAIAVLLISMTFVVSAGGDVNHPDYMLGLVPTYIGLIFFALCTVFTILSGVNYIVRNREVLKEEKHED